MGQWDMSRHKMDKGMLAPEHLLMKGSADPGYVWMKGCIRLYKFVNACVCAVFLAGL